MRITILTAGTRGDVQPYIALGVGLRAAGYEVTIAAGDNFASFVAEYGLPFAPLRADYYQLVNSPEGKAMLAGNPLRMIRTLRTNIFPLMRRLLDDSWAAAQGSDAIIYHPKILSGVHIAEKLGIPAILAVTVPAIVPTSAFPPAGLTTINLGGSLNRLAYRAIDSISGMFGGMVAEWRREVLQLPPHRGNQYQVDGQPVPVMHCYSPQLVPVPGDWPPYVTATGFWFLDRPAAWDPPADLLHFLEEGAPPIYVGFGSMTGTDPAHTARTVIAALERTGQRAVVASGWGGLSPEQVPDTVYLVRDAPHDWLFERMAGVVHHGGAGTVAAGLRAGKPTLVCPFIADQPFWGQRIYQLGVGPEPIAQKKLRVDNLAAAISELASDGQMRERAGRLGARIRSEDGIARAIEFTERYILRDRRAAA